MKKSTIRIMLLAFIISAAAIIQSCKEEADPRQPPDVSFKTGGTYVSDDATVNAGDTVRVGINADRTEDDLISFNISYAYDGSATTVTDTTISLTDPQHFDIDYLIYTRTTAGTEKWVFTITDRDGNISSVDLTLTVL